MEPDKKIDIEPDRERSQSSDTKNAKESSAALFVKVGIIVLSIIMIVGFGIKIVPNAVTVSNTGMKRDLPIYCVNTEEKKIALSFDTAWGNEDIKSILDILAKNQVKATFFVTGDWVEEYPEDVKAIVAAGHDLGNHSDNHKQLLQMSREQCIQEITKAHDKVKKLTGIDMNLFRTPYGEYNNTVVGAARDCGYYTIQWDVDSEDWKDYGADNIYKSAVDNKHLSNGSIILLHNGTKYTAEALEAIIVGLQDKNYELVPVSQMIYSGEYTIDQEGRQFKK